jgi:hypothetical protein
MTLRSIASEASHGTTNDHNDKISSYLGQQAHMEESAKETVIIVHGTWAAPEPGTTRWYQLSDGVPAAKGFIAKLNDALQERDFPARCWAHCTHGNQIFQWSGANSWTARTLAAGYCNGYIRERRPGAFFHAHHAVHNRFLKQLRNPLANDWQ